METETGVLAKSLRCPLGPLTSGAGYTYVNLWGLADTQPLVLTPREARRIFSFHVQVPLTFATVSQNTLGITGLNREAWLAFNERAIEVAEEVTCNWWFPSGSGMVGHVLAAEYPDWDIEMLRDVVKAKPSVDISYVGEQQVRNLLGTRGERVLRQVLDIIKTSAESLGWPLVKVEVRHTRDPEVKDWEYVLLVLVFNCSFDTADKHLHEFYDYLDNLTRRLNDEEREILWRLLFFDIETLAGVSST